MSTSPGEEVVFRRDAHEMRPFAELMGVAMGKVTPEQWAARCVELEERQHVRVAGGAEAGDEIAPRALAQLEVLGFVEIRESWRDAGFDRAFAQQPGAEGVDGAGEEAFQIAER